MHARTERVNFYPKAESTRRTRSLTTCSLEEGCVAGACRCDFFLSCGLCHMQQRKGKTNCNN